MAISDATKFTMGSDVRCTDGVCGTVRRVVVDPVARTLTHLVVEPGRRERDGRLVPIELVSSSWPENELNCTLAEFDKLEPAQELRFLPGARGEWGYQQDEMLSWPYYGLGCPLSANVLHTRGRDQDGRRIAENPDGRDRSVDLLISVADGEGREVRVQLY
jgi:hypothetical protein